MIQTIRLAMISGRVHTAVGRREPAACGGPASSGREFSKEKCGHTERKVNAIH